MRKRYFPTFIGLVVIGAIIIGLFEVKLMLAKKTLDPKHTFVMYFAQSLEGIHVGSNVVYRGIKIGEVVNFEMVIDPRTQKIEIPIFIQFMRGSKRRENTGAILRTLIKRGFRAQLSTTNLFTGEAYIELVQLPESKAILRHPGQDYYEIPTVETGGERTVLAQVLKTAEDALKSVTTLVSSPDVKKLIRSAHQLLVKFRKLTVNVNRNIEPVMVEVGDAAKEVKSGANSVRNLADLLQRHPEALIKGKR